MSEVPSGHVELNFVPTYEAPRSSKQDTQSEPWLKPHGECLPGFSWVRVDAGCSM